MSGNISEEIKSMIDREDVLALALMNQTCKLENAFIRDSSLFGDWKMFNIGEYAFLAEKFEALNALHDLGVPLTISDQWYKDKKLTDAQHSFLSSLGLLEVPNIPRYIEKKNVGAVQRLFADLKKNNVVLDPFLSYLGMALSQKQKEIAKVLIANSVGIEAMYQGISPLHWAIKLRDVDLVYMLLEAGADPDLTDRMTTRPLVSAIKIKDEKLAIALIQGGANTSLIDSNGHTALSLAQILDLQSVVHLLSQSTPLV